MRVHKRQSAEGQRSFTGFSKFTGLYGTQATYLSERSTDFWRDESRRSSLSEKLTVPQQVKKLPPPFDGIRRFITAFATARCLSLSWARPIQSMQPSHFSKIRFNIITLQQEVGDL
jgi:hypothetical protein